MKNLFFPVAGEKLLMEYDFGDGWQVELTLESITKDPDLPGKELPRVFQSLYENGEPMSQASIDFLERAYKRKPKKKPGCQWVWVYTWKDK